MQNRICFNMNHIPCDDSVVMSDDLTDIFINVLALSGAEMARTESEIKFILYLSQSDQRFVGRGCVDFYIVDMPWNAATFDSDKIFLLSVIRGAKNKIGWTKLTYQPNVEYLFPILDRFAELVNRMTVNDILEREPNDWIIGPIKRTERLVSMGLYPAYGVDPLKEGFPRCKIHHTYLTCFGCQICNN